MNTTDADRLAFLWQMDGELGGPESAAIKKLTRDVVHRAVRRLARRHGWWPSDEDVEDIAADTFLAFRNRARSYFGRGDQARGGILLRVVSDMYSRHIEQRKHRNAHTEIDNAALEVPGGSGFGHAAVEWDHALRVNLQLGLAGLKRLASRDSDPEVQKFARLLLSVTTEIDALESDPIAAVRDVLVRQDWTQAAIARVRLRAMRRPEVRAILMRYESLTVG